MGCPNILLYTTWLHHKINYVMNNMINKYI